MFDEEVNLSSLAADDAEAAAEVQSFAMDVSTSFAISVSSSLGVSPESVDVTCLFRNSDSTKLNLLTLEGFCRSSRILRTIDFLQQRRLQAESFGVEIEMVGNDVLQTAIQSDDEDTGQSATEMLASQIASTQVVVESDLLPAGVTVDAAMSEISVTVATQAPTPAPTLNSAGASSSTNTTSTVFDSTGGASTTTTAAPTAANDSAVIVVTTPTAAPTAAPTAPATPLPTLPSVVVGEEESSMSPRVMIAIAAFFL
jgi:hypothetical protein